MPNSENLFRLPRQPWPGEIFEALHQAEGVRIERILSSGHTTPAGDFYDQDDDEWVVLLQGEAELTFFDGSTLKMVAGDYLFIPAHQQHRVNYTSTEPPCVWLAVHVSNKS